MQYDIVCVDVEGFVEWTHCGREDTQDKGRCLPHWSTGELPHRIHETEVLIHTYTIHLLVLYAVA